MKAIQTISGRAVPLPKTNIDTDQIIPSDYLKSINRTGFENGLFAEWRENPDFVLNNPAYKGAKILIAGANFGIGSSREHAVWALQQYGFEAVISPKFGDIFQNNSVKNGLLTITLPQDSVDKLINLTTADPTTEFLISIDTLTVEAPLAEFAELFDLSPAVQERFLNGMDDIDLSLQQEQDITQYETNRPNWLPTVS